MVFEMKKMYIFILLIIIVNPTIVYAQRGCCSHHGGVSGCNSYGRQICNDGTLSPTCTCTPPVIDVYGCTDFDSINYNSNATKDDGSCIKKIYGCMDKSAKNYNENANINDNSCIYYKRGCTDKNAINYNELAEIDDGSCIEKTIENSEEKKEKTREVVEMINDNKEYHNNYKSNNSEADNESNDIFYVVGIALIGSIIYKLIKR